MIALAINTTIVNIPNWLYKAGANFSTIISTSCTMAAMMAINMMRLRKLRSMPAASSPSSQVKAPAFST